MKALALFYTAFRCNKFKIYELIWKKSRFKRVQIQKIHYNQFTATHAQAGTGHMATKFSTDSDVSHGIATLTVTAARGHPGTLCCLTHKLSISLLS